MSSRDDVIQLYNVNISFGADLVLQGVSGKVTRQESIALIGPSGQGKSVLLKIMAGLISPTSGIVKIEGEDWSQMHGAKRKRLLKKLGMLFQRNALFDSLTCAENIAFPLRETTSLSEAEIKDRLEYFLEAVGIADARDLYPDEISGGMQKRLGIARALALDPEIIFYDDPTAGLDPITSKKIIELIIRLREKHKSTVVAVTNDMNRANQLADRIWMVVDKGVIDAGAPDQAYSNKDPRVYQFIRGLLDGPLKVAR